MSEWRKISFQSDETAKANNFQAGFGALFQALLAPRDMALFSRHDLRTGRVDFFLSPLAANKAALLVTPHGPVDCTAPSAEGTTLEVGAADARERLLR